MKLGITVNNERFAVFDPTTGELLSLPNKKPTEGSFIPVAAVSYTHLTLPTIYSV